MTREGFSVRGSPNRARKHQLQPWLLVSILHFLCTFPILMKETRVKGDLSISSTRLRGEGGKGSAGRDDGRNRSWREMLALPLPPPPVIPRVWIPRGSSQDTGMRPFLMLRELGRCSKGIQAQPVPPLGLCPSPGDPGSQSSLAPAARAAPREVGLPHMHRDTGSCQPG